MRRLVSSVAMLAIVAAIGAGASAQQAPAQGAPAAGAPAQGQGGGRAGGGRGGGFNLPPLLMETDAFPDGGIVPSKFTGRGGVQPGFKFSNAPAGTVSYAIIFHDLDVSLMGSVDDVLHWIVWNIPASANGIPEGKVPDGSVQGRGIVGNSYFGPGAPAGPRYHHYVFELYALNANLDLPATAGRPELLKAMEGKIVAKAAYVGRFRGEPAPAK
jgi:Raf kinase inhibitor-like YbhB/YbcL family protein